MPPARLPYAWKNPDIPSFGRLVSSKSPGFGSSKRDGRAGVSEAGRMEHGGWGKSISIGTVRSSYLNAVTCPKTFPSEKNTAPVVATKPRSFLGDTSPRYCPWMFRETPRAKRRMETSAHSMDFSHTHTQVFERHLHHTPYKVFHTLTTHWVQKR